jgi:sugar lactone lactonase YvrE
MQSFTHCLTITIVGLLLAMTAVSCKTTPRTDAPAAQAAASTAKVFYPPAPAPPRLQFLVSFGDAEMFTATQRQSNFSDWVVGVEEQKTRTKFDSPYGIAASNGKLYICDVGFNKVHVVDIPAKTYATLDANGQIVNPVNLTIGPDGTRYICDTGARAIFVFDANDKYQRKIAADGQWSPIDAAISGDRLYVADVTGGRITVCSTGGEVLSHISEKGDGPDQLTNPTNLDIGPDGLIYVTDTIQQIVKKFDTQGRFMGTIGGPGSSLAGFARPKGIAVDPAGVVWVADAQWDAVRAFRSDGQLLFVFGEPGGEPHNMGIPAGLAVDSSSISAFRRYLDPNFQPTYLLFVVNQFAKTYKVAVYAYGRDRTVSADRYEVQDLPPATEPGE